MGLLTTPEGNKTQLARSFAAFVLGPFLTLSAIEAPSLGARTGLILSGVSTSVYNAVHLYLVNRQAEKDMIPSALKGQPIRLIDIFLMGPFLIWAGSMMPDSAIKVLLIMAGIGTIVFNAHNYLVAMA